MKRPPSVRLPAWRPVGRDAGGARRGFTLFEIILSLAILGGAVAVIGEAVRFGARCAEQAMAQTEAQLLCESLLAELTSGVTWPDPVQAAEIPDNPRWRYSVTIAPLSGIGEDMGLLAIEVTVFPAAEDETSRLAARVVRWITDPELSSADSSADSSTGGGSSTTSGATSDTGGTR